MTHEIVCYSMWGAWSVSPGWKDFSCPAKKQLSGHSRNLQIAPKLFENKYGKELEKSDGLDFFS